jgi:hypothetical protein
VDWGDGSISNAITAYNDPDRTHVYANPGKYILKITGLCEAFVIHSVFLPGSDATLDLWTKILAWGNVGLKKFAIYRDSILGYGTSKLTSIPGDPIGGLALLTDTNYFVCNSSITKIPYNIFKYTVNVTSHHYTFHGTRITSIPEHLFDTNINVIDFQTCFEQCDLLVTIPADLFKYNINATVFRWVFSDCWSLPSIPADLFKYNTEALIFNGSFRVCKELSSIPTDLFRFCTKVTTFEACFNECLKLTTVPIDTFRYNPAVITFRAIFSACSLFDVIPTDLFKYNTLVTTFESVFSNTNITSIPTDLFRYNILAESFNYAFFNCDELTALPATLYIYNTASKYFNATHYANRKIPAIPSTIHNTNVLAENFTDCYLSCDIAAGIPPPLWTLYPTAIGTDCFKNTIGLTNYVYIPLAWGGGGMTAIVKNGGFDSDTYWVKMTGTTIGSGIATVTALGDILAGAALWSLKQIPNENILNGDVVNVSFKARRVSGTGNMQMGFAYEAYFTNSLTSTMTTYSFQMTRTVIAANYNLVFGGVTNGDVFEIDDVSITRP